MEIVEKRIIEYEGRFKFILQTEFEQGRRDTMLSALMTNMEQIFQIPVMKNETWEQKNPEVYKLYREIADSRSL